MKIVVLDGYTENPGDLSWDELGKLGELTVYDRTSLTDEDEIIQRIGCLLYTSALSASISGPLSWNRMWRTMKTSSEPAFSIMSI